jgi:ribosome-associated protein
MDFPIKDEYIELCSLLKAANLVMSGGEGKAVVAEGLVTVDGQTETRKRCKIRPGQTVGFEGTEIKVIATSPSS